MPKALNSPDFTSISTLYVNTPSYNAALWKSSSLVEHYFLLWPILEECQVLAPKAFDPCEDCALRFKDMSLQPLLSSLKRPRRPSYQSESLSCPKLIEKDMLISAEILLRGLFLLSYIFIFSSYTFLNFALLFPRTLKREDVILCFQQVTI